MAAALRDPVLVAAVGNRWLKDQGFGIHVVERLRALVAPHPIELVAWECGVIAAFQQLCERPRQHAIFLTAAQRGRRPGTLHQTDAAVAMPGDDEVHGRIGDSVMGLVTLENLLIIAGRYQRLPARTLVIEAEPVDETWGNELSPAVAALVQSAVDAVLAAVQRWSAAACEGGR